MTPHEHLDRTAAPGESEYSWGAGLTPSGLQDAPPSQGGRYAPLCPPVTNVHGDFHGT
ncbi:hypothetical protein FHU29_004076 [Hoyosella altamirensis]|uniref:Uncharacterized protein n=1 Tax=Hoyosella altamirensis TaxID=616997 RepID=A0A839RTP3_9ACTN|nr:hypothetical protein [Hoyosella altamirensis]